MKLVVIGTGYVGLVAGVCFAESGNEVFCVDVDQNKIKRLRDGDPVIYEPGLETLLKKNIKSHRIFFTDNVASVIGDADVVFTAVGTPTGEDGSADLTYLFKAAEQFAPYLKEYTLVVNKCTVPVGTVGKLKEIINSKKKDGATFDVASNPEFLKEGMAVQDFMYPDRVVVGCETEHARQILESLYEPFVKNGNPIYFMDIKSAEMTKYAANCFLATKISFINDIAVLCEKVGADINHVRQGITSDHRIGKAFFYPGVGYGGSCFPKDVKALIHTAESNGVDLSVVRAAENVNALQKKRFLQKILDYFHGNVKGKTIAVWGLAFKPQTDDMREAPSIFIIEELANRGAFIKATDPIAIENAKRSIRAKVEYFDDHLTTLNEADAIVIVTEWNEYRTHDIDKIKENFRGRVVFDGRNIFDPLEIKKAGYEYFGVGRR